MQATEKNILWISILVAGLTLGAAAVEAAPALDQEDVHSFVMVHFETGGDREAYFFQDIVEAELGLPPEALSTRSLTLQWALWPTAVRLVQTAEAHGVRLTLALQPQWAEFILRDPRRVETVRQWVTRGHEIAIHHHGINHVDWNGYTNRFQGQSEPDDRRFLEKYRSPARRGTARDGMSWLWELAARIGRPNLVRSGCITDTRIDKPDSIRVLTTGSEDIEQDLVSRPSRMTIPGGELIWLSHASLRSNFNSQWQMLYDEEQNRALAEDLLQDFQQRYDDAGAGDVVGVVFHCFDFYRMPDVYERWFQFLASRGQAVRTVYEIAKQAEATEGPAPFSYRSGIRVHPARGGRP